MFYLNLCMHIYGPKQHHALRDKALYAEYGILRHWMVSWKEHVTSRCNMFSPYKVYIYMPYNIAYNEETERLNENCHNCSLSPLYKVYDKA